MEISAIDIGITLIILVSALFGVMRGIIRTLFALLACVLALLGALMFTEWLARLLLPNYPLLSTLIAFVVIFVGILVLVSLPGALAAKLIGASGMKFVDRSAGFVFGILRGIVIVLALVWLLGVIPGVKSAMEKENSMLLPFFISGVETVKPWLDGLTLPDLEEVKPESKTPGDVLKQ
jgi:membrane protein required for colicin V production